MSVGRVRATISGVTSRVNGIMPSRTPSAIEITTPPVTAAKERATNGILPRVSPTATPNIGVINGETSIAPMTTAGLLAMRPKPAISVARPSRTK
ncbi:MAG: hypothetical protein U9P00_13200 [Pseudomonadota bacterium]|nr:hypothetical protein [Pseudomonadota bacterium]